MNRTIKNNLLWFLFFTVLTFPTSALALGDALIQGLFGVLISPLIKPKDTDKRAEELRVQADIENRRKELQDERERISQQNRSLQQPNSSSLPIEILINNPNKLPLCGSVRHNCWDTYTYSGTHLGDRYVGEFQNGEPDGQGNYFHVSGSKYYGEFKDGKKHGRGVFAHANGNRYEGELKYDMPHGQGTINYANGDKYVGEFSHNKKSGQGTFQYIQGHSYVGEWRDDKPNGKGRETHADDRTPNQGIFKNGQFIAARDGEWITTLNGCKVWNPFPQVNETVEWNGRCTNGYIDGFGKLESPRKS